MCSISFTLRKKKLPKKKKKQLEKAISMVEKIFRAEGL